MNELYWKPEDGIFFDDFNSETVDTEKWEYHVENWGGTEKINGRTVAYNGGVIAENIKHMPEGGVKFEAHGNFYRGDVRGTYPVGLARNDNIRTGAILRTKKAFASGRYEVMAKPCPKIGSCTAFWSFDLLTEGDGHLINHEIDFEIPGKVTPETENEAFDYCLCNNWTGVLAGENSNNRTKAPVNLADGNFHHFRYDWHTGDKEKNIVPHTDFYIDGVYLRTVYEAVPQNAGLFYIGVWFPNAWEGIPDFDISDCQVKWVRITPFFESGDRFAGGLRTNTAETLSLELEDTQWPYEYTDHDRMIARAIVFDDERNLYFVKAQRDDAFGNVKLIETSGGGIEEGEDQYNAIRRELKEELGADADVITRIGVVSDYYNLIHRHNINYYFLCRVRSFGENHLTKDEIESFHLTAYKTTYEGAKKEYTDKSGTRLGKLLAARELPILEKASELIEQYFDGSLKQL